MLTFKNDMQTDVDVSAGAPDEEAARYTYYRTNIRSVCAAADSPLPYPYELYRASSSAGFEKCVWEHTADSGCRWILCDENEHARLRATALLDPRGSMPL